MNIIMIFAQIMLCFYILVLQSNSKTLMLGLDYQRSAFYKCFKQTGQNQIALGLELQRQDESIQNILQAKNAGLSVDIVFFPCRKRTPEQIAQYFMNKIGLQIFQRIWLGPNYNYVSEECNWNNYPAEQNCIHLKNLINTLNKYKINANVITMGLFWQYFLGSRTACPEIDSLLWWIPTQQQQNKQPDFENYVQIGGWKAPYMKKYEYKIVCGAYMSENYYH